MWRGAWSCRECKRDRAMDLLSLLRSFVLVADAGSFSAVARASGISQPAISRQIATLEAHVGVRLVQRSTRSLTLTEEGGQLLLHARQVLDAVEQTRAAVGRAGTAGRVRLAMPAGLAGACLVPRLGTLLERCPELR